MTRVRVTTEAQSHATAQWATDSAGPQRKYRPPRGDCLRRKLLRRARKSVGSRYCQLLPGHAAIGPYLRDKVHKTDDDRCWWCACV